jgi:hypothetical protein
VGPNGVAGMINKVDDSLHSVYLVLLKLLIASEMIQNQNENMDLYTSETQILVALWICIEVWTDFLTMSFFVHMTQFDHWVLVVQLQINRLILLLRVIYGNSK